MKINIKTTGTAPDGLINKEEYSYTGTLSCIKDSVYIKYDSENDGIKSSNIIKYKDGAIERTVKGESTSTMRFIEGRETTTNYITPYGTFPMRIMTIHIGMRKKEEGIYFEIEYMLTVSGEMLGNYNMQIDVCS